MVDAYNIAGLQGFLDSLDPPGKALLLMGFPVIDGIAPQLPLIGEGIRGYAAGNSLPAFLVHLEQMSIRPCIHTVGSNENRNVSDDLDAVGVGVDLYTLPLGEEEILLNLDDIKAVGKLFLDLFQGCCLSKPELLGPNLEPARVVVVPAKHLVQGVIVEPPGILGYKALIGCQFLRLCICKKLMGGLLQQRFLEGTHHAVIDSF